jgi:hypothetical protein
LASTVAVDPATATPTVVRVRIATPLSLPIVACVTSPLALAGKGAARALIQAVGVGIKLRAGLRENRVCKNEKNCCRAEERKFSHDMSPDFPDQEHP